MAGQRQLDDEAEPDHDHQRHHQRLELAKAARLQCEDQQHFDAGQGDAEGKVEAEQQLERDRRADQLGKVAGDDGELAEQPEEHPGRGAVALAAGLREIEAGDDAEPRRQALQEHRHEVGEHDDGEQPVAEGRSAGNAGRPVAGIHVAHGDEVTRAREGEELAPERSNRNADAAMRSPPGEKVGGKRIGRRHRFRRRRWRHDQTARGLSFVRSALVTSAAVP